MDGGSDSEGGREGGSCRNEKQREDGTHLIASVKLIYLYFMLFGISALSQSENAVYVASGTSRESEPTLSRGTLSTGFMILKKPPVDTDVLQQTPKQ